MKRKKLIGITQRVVFDEKYNETRDCLDHEWFNLILYLGYMPVPLPNISTEYASTLLKDVGLDGVILSGGNSIALPEIDELNISPKRDLFERALLDECLKQNIPLLGVCRGMQLINIHFGGHICPIKEHTGKHYHNLKSTINAQSISFPKRVNTFHNWAISPKDFATSLQALAHDENDNIEAFCHVTKPIIGIMWHPEREKPFKDADIKLIGSLFS